MGIAYNNFSDLYALHRLYLKAAGVQFEDDAGNEVCFF